MKSDAPDHPPRFATYAPGRGRGQDWAMHETVGQVKLSIKNCAESLWDRETHEYGPRTTRVKAVYQIQAFEDGMKWIKMTPEEFLKLYG